MMEQRPGLVPDITLADFLLARLAEDEQVALSASKREDDRAWKMRSHEADTWMITDGTGEVVVYDEGWPSDGQAEHIVRHDPARVLREVETKRAIIAHHGDQHDCGDRESWEYPYVGCRDLRALALPYVDHLDYRAEEWAP